MFTPVPKRETEPRPGQIAIMCRACRAPIAHIFLNSPTGLSIALTEHYKKTGHTADDFYTEPKTQMEFFAGHDRIGFSSTGE